MKLRISIVLLFLCCVLVLHGQTAFSAKGYDALRIENEIKLIVPNSLEDSVWSYLLKRYDNQNLFLKEFDSTFHTKFAEELFVDQYYDNEEMQLLKNQNSIRHRTRYVLSDTTDKKHGKELIQVKINNVESNELKRGEYKYEVKYYDKQDDLLDIHPLFSIVRRKHRTELADRLKEYNINAIELFPTINIEQNRNRVYIYRANTPFATVTLDHIKGTYGRETTHFTELELELNEINYTTADSDQKKHMEEIIALIKQDVLSAFPAIKQDQTPKYNKAFLALGIEDFNTSPNYLDSNLLWVGLIALLIVIIFFLTKRKRKGRIYKMN